mmetsp:Transcript_3030/g.7488  ORF Transcript_3030/g.7488 Transcript_3030/m.7488 type:complete len:203 (-) Transcript_3030:174-782(-)
MHRGGAAGGAATAARARGGHAGAGRAPRKAPLPPPALGSAHRRSPPLRPPHARLQRRLRRQRLCRRWRRVASSCAVDSASSGRPHVSGVARPALVCCELGRADAGREQPQEKEQPGGRAARGLCKAPERDSLRRPAGQLERAVRGPAAAGHPQLHPEGGGAGGGRRAGGPRAAVVRLAAQLGAVDSRGGTTGAARPACRCRC